MVFDVVIEPNTPPDGVMIALIVFASILIVAGISFIIWLLVHFKNKEK